MERKKGQWPSFHILLCPGLLVVLQSPGPPTWRPSPAHIPCFHSLPAEALSPETSPAYVCPLAELFENTDAVFLISASPGPSAGTGRQQLVEWKLEASQSQASPSWRVWCLQGHSLKGRAAAGCSLGRDRFCKGFSGGLPSFLLNTCASSSRNGILIPVKHQLPPTVPVVVDWTPHTTQEMRPTLDPHR